MKNQQLFSAPAGTKVSVKPDCFVLTDGAAAEIADRLSEVKPFDPSKVKVFIDHQTPCGSEIHANKQHDLIAFAAKNNCELYNGYGTSYQLLIEKHADVGDVIAHCGDFGSTYAAKRAYAVKLSADEMLEALSTGELSLSVPEKVYLVLNAELGDLASAKDAALTAVSMLGDTRGKLVCVSGEGLDSLSDDERIAFFHLLSLGGCDAAAQEAPFEKADFELDLGNVCPVVLGPTLDAELSAADALGEVSVSSVFIGGCSAGRIEDIRNAVSVIRGRRVNRKVRLTVAFASSSVYIQAANEGLIASLIDAGAVVMNQGCSGCYARSQAMADAKDVVLSAGSRMCPNCNGDGNVPTYLCSAQTAMESAIRGYICPTGK